MLKKILIKIKNNKNNNCQRSQIHVAIIIKNTFEQYLLFLKAQLIFNKMIDFLNHNQARLFKNSDFCLNYIVFSISNFNLLNLKFLYNYIGK